MAGLDLKRRDEVEGVWEWNRSPRFDVLRVCCFVWSSHRFGPVVLFLASSLLPMYAVSLPLRLSFACAQLSIQENWQFWCVHL